MDAPAALGEHVVQLPIDVQHHPLEGMHEHVHQVGAGHEVPDILGNLA